MQLTQQTPTKPNSKKTQLALIFIFLFIIVLIFVYKRTPDKTDLNFTSFKGYVSRDFPNIPIYPGAKALESRKLAGAKEKESGYNATWSVETEKSAPEIANWYKLELEKLGWRFQEPDHGNVIEVEAIYQATKEGSELMLFVEKENTKTAKILIEIPLAY